MSSSDPVQQMLAWLADKDPDVRHEIAQHLNWDSSVPVLAWIVGRPDCDGATAASVLWMGDPQYYAENLLAGRPVRPSEELDLLRQILHRFREGAYVRHELTPFAGWEHMPGRYRAALGDAADPLDLPPVLFQRGPGRPPRVPSECDPRRSAQAWDRLAALGSYLGRRPPAG